MKHKIFFLLSTIMLVFQSCNSYNVEVNIYKWETSTLMFTTYFYDVQNNSSSDLIVDFVVEATCEDGAVYSNEEWLEISAHKTRKSSQFFNTDGKKVTKFEVVDIKTRLNPF